MPPPHSSRWSALSLAATSTRRGRGAKRLPTRAGRTRSCIAEAFCWKSLVRRSRRAGFVPAADDRERRVPDRRALRVVGRGLPGPPPTSRPPTLRTNPTRTLVAHQSADRVRTRSGPKKDTYLAAHFAQLRGRRGELKGDRRDPPRPPPRRRLPLRLRPSPVPRTRPRLATQALLTRTPRPATAKPTRSGSATPSRSTKPNQQNKRLS